MRLALGTAGDAGPGWRLPSCRQAPRLFARGHNRASRQGLMTPIGIVKVDLLIGLEANNRSSEIAYNIRLWILVCRSRSSPVSSCANVTANFIISGHSGSGFSEKGIDEAVHRMKPLSRDKSRFDNPQKVKERIQWIEPKLVCEPEANAKLKCHHLHFRSSIIKVGNQNNRMGAQRAENNCLPASF
jgi:hypothetical protein